MYSIRFQELSPFSGESQERTKPAADKAVVVEEYMQYSHHDQLLVPLAAAVPQYVAIFLQYVFLHVNNETSMYRILKMT